MDTVTQVNVPLRGGKKMKKRKELDALVAHSVNKRNLDVKRASLGGTSSHETLYSDTTDEQEYSTSSTGGNPSRCHSRRYTVHKKTCSTFLMTCSGILIFSCIAIATVVMWLFIDVREQVTSLRTELNQVVAGSQGVPDALQKCHTLSKDLQKNQSQIMERFNGFSAKLNNFTAEMSEIKNTLHTVQNQLKSSPDLINNPTIVKDLSTSVSSFGSQIKDQGATILSLRDQNQKLDSLVNNLSANITGIAEMLNAEKEKLLLIEKNFAAEKDRVLAAINQISVNITAVKDTLSDKLQGAVDGRANDHKLMGILQEMYKNVTARVAYLEGLYAKQAKHSLELPFAKQDPKSNPEAIPQIPSFPSVQQPPLESDRNEPDITKMLENHA